MRKKGKSLTCIAIYARKSKFTGKGESIENQIQKCREYLKSQEDYSHDNIEIIEYKDEGVSGNDMERPMMKQLYADIRAGKIQVLVCYRLDRVSRSVRDFSELLMEITERNKGEFISVNESFDTRTPMGRAMMYISSVFAQLERETIAERITDNMYALAKTGRWLGGNTPLGYISEKVEAYDEDGKKRSRHRLVEVPEEIELVKLIYQKYLELGSQTKLETYLMNRDIHTRNGKNYGRYVLRFILSNPVYCVADRNAYDFLWKNHYGIFAEESMFDGHHALIAYNKNNAKGKVQRSNDVEDWIVAVAEHKGIIPSDMWIQVQKKLASNSELSYRYPKGDNGALLSGILRCGDCGSYMRPKNSRVAKDGVMRYSYVCQCKERSRGNKCQMPNALGNLLDGLVVDQILELKDQMVTEYDYLQDALHKIENVTYQESGQNLIKKQLQETEKQMNAFLDALGKSQNEATTNVILGRIDELNKTKEVLQKEYNEIQSNQVMQIGGFDCALLSDELMKLTRKTWDKLAPAKQKDILKLVIKEIVWDGEYAVIHLWAEDDSVVKSA